jgi:hypothetical protein
MAFIILLGRGFDLPLSGLFDFNALETRVRVSAKSVEDPVLLLRHSTALWVGPERVCEGNLRLGIAVIDICMINILGFDEKSVYG